VLFIIHSPDYVPSIHLLRIHIANDIRTTHVQADQSTPPLAPALCLSTAVPRQKCSVLEFQLA